MKHSVCSNPYYLILFVVVLMSSCVPQSPLQPTNSAQDTRDSSRTDKSLVHQPSPETLDDTSQTQALLSKQAPTTSDTSASPVSPVTSSSQDAELAGSWRVYSERLYYDIGGAGALGIPVSRRLDLEADGTWAFGDSHGTWSTSAIDDRDWKQWDIAAYGPTTKIVVEDWNQATAMGPLERTGSRTDFIWLIYHVKPPTVNHAGVVWIKFGRV